MFGDAFRDRRVLVTGHTGFKGSWLSHWLLKLGARVSGIALPPSTTPDIFGALGLAARLDHRLVDIRDAARLAQAVAEVRPEIILHLAAQPLVRASYQDPKATWDINVGGTVNLLEAVRATQGVRAVVVVTSDKCYENQEWVWGYRENDPMGGHDPYSASKGATELVAASYRRSFFSDGGVRLATGRAGNVIGGGDWSADRIVTDFVASIQAGRVLSLRNPGATRPWQHVLEPLSGYLALAARMYGADGQDYAEAWNFGPDERSVATVADLAHTLVIAWGSGSVEATGPRPGQPHEAGLLKLDCSKASSRLGWRGAWGMPKAVQSTVDWYKAHARHADMLAFSDNQIASYVADQRHLDAGWTR